MDLSEALQALTRAVEENTKALIMHGGAAPGGSHKPAAAGSTPAPATPAPAAEAPKELDYETDVKPLALRVSAEAGRESLVTVLSEFGVKRATELKPEQYADFINRCNRQLYK